MAMREKIEAIEEAALYFDENTPFIDDAASELFNDVTAAIPAALAEADRLDAELDALKREKAEAAEAWSGLCNGGWVDNCPRADELDRYFGRE